MVNKKLIKIAYHLAMEYDYVPDDSELDELGDEMIEFGFDIESPDFLDALRTYSGDSYQQIQDTIIEDYFSNNGKGT